MNHLELAPPPALVPGRILLVGALTTDVFADHTAPGGAVRFAARVAAAFGQRATIVALGGEGTDEHTGLEGHALHVVANGNPETFRHDLDNGRRRLTLLTRPHAPLTLADVPEGWRAPDLLVLAPLLADDLDLASLRRIQAHHVLLIGQGLVRRVGTAGTIEVAGAPPDELLAALDERTILALSDEETAAWPAAALGAAVARASLLLVTRGDRGVDIVDAEGREHVAAAPARLVDATGAGDVFASAFALALVLGAVDGTREAAKLASTFAAASVERAGPASLPPLTDVRQRMRRSLCGQTAERKAG